MADFVRWTAGNLAEGFLAGRYGAWPGLVCFLLWLAGWPSRDNLSLVASDLLDQHQGTWSKKNWWMRMEQ